MPHRSVKKEQPDLAARLRAALAWKGSNLARWADEQGWSYNYVYQVLRGQRTNDALLAAAEREVSNTLRAA